jgi:triosephosphate isomerase
MAQLDSYLKVGGTIVNSAEKIIFVYEPPGAISGGGDYHAEDPVSADHACQMIVEKLGRSVVVIYGGSVNPDNIKQFLDQPHISGALVGQASLSIESFSTLIGACAI